MDISGIKKNKFWISIGGVIVIVIAFYFCVVGPFRSRNSEKIENIERLLTKLERYASKGHKIRNKKWIKAEKMKLEAARKIQHGYEQFYKERDTQLEKIFGSFDGEEIEDEALWANRYIQETDILLDRIKARAIPYGKNALHFKQWREKIPSWEEIIPEQKRFWITEALVNIILKEELEVDYFEGINFEIENAVSGDTTHTELYDTIPFTVEVGINVERLFPLINEFLKSELSFEIETIGLNGELNRLRMPETVEKSPRSGDSVQKRSFQSPSIVNVVISAYVLDFKI